MTYVKSFRGDYADFIEGDINAHANKTGHKIVSIGYSISRTGLSKQHCALVVFDDGKERDA